MFQSFQSLKDNIHRRDTEFAEFGGFLSRILFSACSASQDSSTRFFPDHAGKTRFVYRRTADKSTDDHGIASVMPAWIAGIQVRRDASGDIHVNLGSGNPCRYDDIEEYASKLTKFSVANSRTPKNHRVTLRAATNMLVFVDE
jgi:hypothetical protein